MSNFLAEPQHLIGHSTARFRIVQRGGNFRAESVAPPGFCNRGEVRYGSVGGLEYEVPQSRLYCLCINVALCSTALQCICRVIRRSSMAMKAHTYFGRPPIGGKLPSLPLGGATGRSNTRGGSVAEWLACWTHRHFLTPICTDGLSAWVELAALPQTP